MVDSGQPVSGVLLHERNQFLNRPRELTKAGKDGLFKAEGLAPGVDYFDFVPFDKTLYCRTGLLEINIIDNNDVEGFGV